MAQILVVDDNPLIREMVIDMLLIGDTSGEHTIIEAANGKEAQQKITEAIPGIDLVITDYGMPRMNGVQLTDWIKKTHPGIPVVLMSSDDLSKTSPADVFVRKPEGFTDFSATCNQLLNHGRRRHEEKKV